MAITLTTSITKTANYQGITKMEFFFPHVLNDLDDSIIMDKTDIIVVFHVTTWAEDGSELEVKRHHAPYPGWPALFTDDVKEVYSRLEQYAISQGYLGDGTAEPVG